MTTCVNVSDDHIARLRAAYDAFSRGDFDEALTYAHPDIEFAPPNNGAPIRGVNTFRSWMEPDAFDWQVIEPVSFTVSGDKVLVEQHMRARGAGSGSSWKRGRGVCGPSARAD